MSIQFSDRDNFDVKENNIQKESEQELVKEDKKITVSSVNKQKTKLKQWTNVLFVISLIATIYAVLFVLLGFVMFIPSIILWAVWLVMVILLTIVTFGCVWVSEKFKNFSNKFKNFNEKVSGLSVKITEFVYASFPYFASIFGGCVIAYLILSIVGFKRQKKVQAQNPNEKPKESFKSNLIWSIILICVFAVAIAIDGYVVMNVSK